MPVPQSIDDLSVTASQNSPPSSENVGPIANQYFQSAFAFIKQLANGALIKPLAAVNMNKQKLTGLANGDTSSASTDALTGAQVRELAYKVGEIREWSGAVANISKVWGPGWQLADGTNGTPDLRDRFRVGAGATYKVGDKGGRNWVGDRDLPKHGHPITDYGHGHSITDYGHGHATDQQPHDHTVPSSAGIGQGAGGGNSVQQSGGSMRTGESYVSIGIRAAATGIVVNSAKIGITVDSDPNAPGVMDIRPPYYALCVLCYTGMGA